MDFGIARAVSDSSASIAETSTIVGTAQYFSPEQARGEAVDARTDLYSTGIVLFEMLTARAPFTGDNPVAVAYQHVNQQALPPSAINPRVSPALDAVVLRAMSKDRFERFQTAGEFRIDAETAAAGSIPVRKSVQPNEFNATLFGVNPNSRAGSDATFRQLNVDQNDRIARTQNRPPVAWIWGGVAVLIVIIVAVFMWVQSVSQPTVLTGNVSIAVPAVTGTSYEDAQKALSEAKLVAERIDQASADVPVNAVIGTDPEAGIKVAPGESITVYVSSGAETVKVPQMTGKDQVAAAADLEAAGLVVATPAQVYSPNIKAGTVISASPAPGESVAQGSTVTMTISNGFVQVPDVGNMDVGTATSALLALQLDVKAVGDLSCSGGKVSSQSLKGDQPQKSAITINYCNKP
jgi:serine/threonine-protein kinase